jgi:hypothetical protein
MQKSLHWSRVAAVRASPANLTSIQCRETRKGFYGKPPIVDSSQKPTTRPSAIAKQHLTKVKNVRNIIDPLLQLLHKSGEFLSWSLNTDEISERAVAASCQL